MNTIEKCRCCNIDIDITIPIGYAKWTVADSSINLPDPPIDISGAFICDSCYIDGPTLEQRIRNNISLKLVCRCCDILVSPQYYKWTGSDIQAGVPAPVFDMQGSIICINCWGLGPKLEQRIRDKENVHVIKQNYTIPGSQGENGVIGDKVIYDSEIVKPIIEEPIRTKMDYWNQPYPKMGQKIR